MEKRTPHSRLSAVKALIKAGKVRTTHAARVGATALGFDYPGMLEVVLELKPKDFYKSMTTHADHTIWQDVYRPSTVAGDVYLKLTIIDDVLIVSFKEL
jgi:motility quorum-sensing regulator / GCU-specific mRNA interferase toxin